jgi:hypothetical protein
VRNATSNPLDTPAVGPGHGDLGIGLQGGHQSPEGRGFTRGRGRTHGEYRAAEPPLHGLELLAQDAVIPALQDEARHRPAARLDQRRRR